MTYSDRTVYIAAHVTEWTKKDLREVTRKMRFSMSAFIAQAIIEKLQRYHADQGVKIDDHD